MSRIHLSSGREESGGRSERSQKKERFERDWGDDLRVSFKEKLKKKGLEFILFDFSCLHCFREGLHGGVKIKKNKDRVYSELSHRSKSEKGALRQKEITASPRDLSGR